MGETIRDILGPSQVGVRTPNGCEAVTHEARQKVDPSWATVVD